MGYEILKTIHEGPGALLKEARCSVTKRKVVLKVWKDLEAGLSALRVYKELFHPAILPLYQAYYEKDQLVMVFPQVPRGSLAQVEHLDRREKRQLAQGLAACLVHLHRSGVIHHDLKPGNILIGEDGSPYLIDLSRPGDYSPGFGAPEKNQKGAAVDERSDIYSLGKVLEVVAKKGRWVDQHLMQVARRAQARHRLKRYQDMAALCRDLKKKGK